MAERTMTTQQATPFLIARDGMVCPDCGRTMWVRGSGEYQGLPSAQLTVDHVVPRAAGGKDRVSNYQLVCRRCNGKRWLAWKAAHPELAGVA